MHSDILFFTTSEPTDLTSGFILAQRNYWVKKSFTTTKLDTG
jgi:hypothetical protein